MSEPGPEKFELDYSPPPRRRLTRRRLVLAILLLCALAVVWKWGGGVWRQGRLLYAQRRCASYSMPADQVIFDEASVSSSAATMPIPQLSVSPPPVPWMQFLAQLQPNNPLLLFRSSLLKGPEAVLFLHELTASAGNRRLVCVKFSTESRRNPAGQLQHYYYLRPIVIDPARWTTPPALKESSGRVRVISAGVSEQPPNVRAYGGQIDPLHPSRFSFRVNAWGQDSIIDVQLENDDSIFVVPRGRLRAPTTKQE